MATRIYKIGWEILDPLQKYGGPKYAKTILRKMGEIGVIRPAVRAQQVPPSTFMQWKAYNVTRPLANNTSYAATSGVGTNQRCGGETRPEGLSRGPRVLGEELTAAYRPSSPPRGFAERCKLPGGGPGESPGQSSGRQEFWCIFGSSGELPCSPANSVYRCTISCIYIWLT